jgi:hypothetical protein
MLYNTENQLRILVALPAQTSVNNLNKYTKKQAVLGRTYDAHFPLNVSVYMVKLPRII